MLGRRCPARRASTEGRHDDERAAEQRCSGRTRSSGPKVPQFHALSLTRRRVEEPARTAESQQLPSTCAGAAEQRCRLLGEAPEVTDGPGVLDRDRVVEVAIVGVLVVADHLDHDLAVDVLDR